MQIDLGNINIFRYRFRASTGSLPVGLPSDCNRTSTEISSGSTSDSRRTSLRLSSNQRGISLTIRAIIVELQSISPGLSSIMPA